MSEYQKSHDKFRVFYPHNGILISLVSLIVVEVVLFKLTLEYFVFLWILPIVHCAYLYRDYEIKISDEGLILQKICKRRICISYKDINYIYIENSRIKQGIFGVTQMMYIQTNTGGVKFDVYKFNNKRIVEELKKYSDSFGYMVSLESEE